MKQETPQPQGDRAAMAKQGVVALKMVVPVVPRRVGEKVVLEEDLRRMGLTLRLWSIKYEKIAQELQQKQDNKWHEIVQQGPEKWTIVAWRKVYKFSIKGKATQEEKHAEGKFTHPPHSKDRYPLPECKDLRGRRLLEFLVPIFYLEKLARVTVMVGNTIFGAYKDERDVDWALVVKDTVRRLLTEICKSKPTPNDATVRVGARSM